ncbi:phosphoglucosamine mutase [Candidatus Dependentiae bacterium]|nr:phosphoglucosamine mutase [Candidatus Dependentiae bacterium]MBU4387045.1 phosphoglucosamine mutase [Candidatus Dependentiae bacterium]MCG2756687.1 phosphoglucosamine mutase [Candidatus Dependentiae bacterium]
MNKTIKFGTDGIRGNASSFPFDTQSLITLGYSIAQWSIKKYKKSNPKILIGHDTRESCAGIKKDLETGLLNFDLEILDAQIMPTPAICKIINTDKSFDFGIIISASHNKYQDNGIKLVDAKKGKLSLIDEKIIETNFKNNFNNIKIENLNKSGSIKLFDNSIEKYIEILENNFSKKLLINKKIVLDCANGATYKIAPIIFQSLGAQIIAINTVPNGKNINENCGSLHIEQLTKNVVENKYDFGFAFDGDGDRVIAVDKNGEKIDGDQIIAILTNHKKAKNLKTIVGTSMTNLGLYLHLQKRDINLIRTDVGDKYIAKELRAKKLFLGGESSGHIIMTDYLNVGDGIFTALRTIETIIDNNILNPKQFNYAPQTLINMPVKEKKDLNIDPIPQIIEKYKNILKTGRILIRYSGTENILRIMTEGEDEIITKNIAQNIAQELDNILN